jgi:hypothetical protein
MISKLRFSMIAVMLLVLLGFGFQNQAKGQAGENAQFCPFVEVPTGWLKIEDVTPTGPLNFSGALIGTVEGIGGAALGGMDWMHVDFTNFDQPTPTNETGSQAVTWWTQKGGRNTFVQLTNADFSTWVHVRMLDENCVEIRNFCDFYTPGDTHVYDFGDLITNNGDTPDDNVLQGHEGFLTITAVDDCPSPDVAIEHNGLAATIQVIDDIEYSYGYNANHRWAVCFDEEVPVDFNRIFNGSFQDGLLGPWNLTQGNSDVIDSDGINPAEPVPPCVGPDCDDPDANLFMAYAASSGLNNGVFDNRSPSYLGGPFPDLADTTLINSGFTETNVSVVTSNIFTTTSSNTVFYDLLFLGPSDLTCDNYAAVCLIQVDTDGIPPVDNNLWDCNCYVPEEGAGSISTSTGSQTCIPVVTSDDVDSVISPRFDFEGGASSFLIGETLSIPFAGTWAVQYITGQSTELNGSDCADSTDPTEPDEDTGALVDNFRVIETEIELIICDGTLTGAFNAFLTDFLPTQFAGQFNTVGDDGVGGDAIMMNFADEYLPNYRTLGAFVTAEIGIFDDFEDFQSCGDVLVCFIRLGIDADVPISDEFSPSPITSPPTSTPPTTITPPPPTSVPPSNGGGGGSCAIAASPVQLGTAFANVLIPLVPVAFAFGVRAVRRRKK